jgi:hypothetical protein
MKSGCQFPNIRTPAGSLAGALVIVCVLVFVPASAAQIQGQVLGAGMPITNSTVTLWAAGTGAPQQLDRHGNRQRG